MSPLTAVKGFERPIEVDGYLPDRKPSDNREMLHEDLDLEKFLLDVVKSKSLDVNIVASVVDGEIIETMEGASNVSVTVHDPHRKLIESGVFHEEVSKERIRVRKIDVKLDGLYFRLVQINKAGDDVTLVFEDRDVNRMRQHKGPMKVARGKVTRAEFQLRLARAVKSSKIRFFCPELHKKQPIAGAKKDERKEVEKRRREAGVDRDAELTVKGADATREQLKNMDTVLKVADSHDAPDKATLALVEACIVESQFRNLKGGEGTSVGILQLTSGKKARRNIKSVVARFLVEGFTGRGGAIALAKKNPKMSAGEIAQAVQGSAHPGRYDQYREEAEKIIEAYGHLGHNRLYRKYEFKVEKNETFWAAGQRLAEEVNWRLFMVRGWLYYISEEDLIKSRARATITEDDDEIDSIDWDVDEGKPVQEATVQTHIHRWGVPPGAVVRVKKAGPGNGRWLVSNIRRKLFTSEATVTLKRATPEKPEPRPEIRTESESDELGGGNAAEVVYARAKSIRKANRPYVWGGGHGEAGKPSGGGYDCSGGVAAALEAADLIPSSWKSGVPASGTMARSYGKPGKGKTITLWANGGHVFLEVKINGKWIHLGTGRWGEDHSGFGPKKKMHPKGGFTPRHWPGT